METFQEERERESFVEREREQHPGIGTLREISLDTFKADDLAHAQRRPDYTGIF